jgi:glycosyltransferase involved in cell wall biosynthesis
VASLPGRRLLEAVSAAHPDLVHTSNLPGFSTAVWAAARDAGAPVVHTLHDYHLLCPRTTLLRREGMPCRPHPLLCGLRTRRLARHAPAVSQVVAGSRHLLRRHDGFFPAAASRVIRLPLKPVGAAVPPPALPPRTLGYIGALTRSKGVGLLLEAAPALARAGLELLIAGDGPLRAEVEACGAVRYEGLVQGEAKTAFLTSCDAGLVPSLWEEPSGPPYVVLEWLAAGRPVLATARGGLAEAQELGGVAPLEPTVEGLLEAAGREERTWRELAAALPAVAGDEDVERWLDEHEDVYAAALGRRAQAGATA